MARVLLVDDQPLNLELLHAYLDGGSHQVDEARSGAEALAKAEARPPDLVLSDIIMPEMNGFELTRRLKALKPDEYLPIILITALTDASSRQLGLKTGADDFITRPIDRIELGLRIGNLLSLRQHRQELARSNVELLELHRFKEEMSALLIHDLKNPVSVIQAGIAFAQAELRDGRPVDEALEALADADEANRRLQRLLANLLDVVRLENNRLQLRRATLSASTFLKQIAGPRRRLTDARSVTLEVDTPELPLSIDADLITRVIENLLDNAIRYAPTGGRIVLAAKQAAGKVTLTVGNNGPPIPPAARATVFEKFGQASSKVGRMNLGLGLYFCRLVVEAHGGHIAVIETPELPTVFMLELPAS